MSTPKSSPTPPLRVDTVGLRCPHPVLALSNATHQTPEGTIVEIVGDCPTFEKDIREFCRKRNKSVLVVTGKAPLLTIRMRF